MALPAKSTRTPFGMLFDVFGDSVLAANPKALSKQISSPSRGQPSERDAIEDLSKVHDQPTTMLPSLFVLQNSGGGRETQPPVPRPPFRGTKRLGNTVGLARTDASLASERVCIDSKSPKLGVRISRVGAAFVFSLPISRYWSTSTGIPYGYDEKFSTAAARTPPDSWRPLRTVPSVETIRVGYPYSSTCNMSDEIFAPCCICFIVLHRACEAI
ncbi:hypothetical protein DFH09DRAFT_1082337 [Mycena vulgaris]|nr:hypothetical protein DFH09DRAFT_1082337 [Mycena vulgaris]